LRKHAFVREFVKDRNGTQAALRAGYTKSAGATACFLLHHPEVGKLIREKERRLEERAEIDQAWVMDQLRDNVHRCIEMGELATLNRSLELIGKQIGMFVDRSNIHIALDRIERVDRRVVYPDQITDADFLELPEGEEEG